MYRRIGAMGLKGVLAASLLLSAAVLPESGSAVEKADIVAADSGHQRFKEEAAACRPDKIDYAQQSFSDLVFQPLFGARKADHADLEKVCGALKKAAAEGVEMQLPPDINDRFFSGYTVRMTSGLYLTFTGRAGRFVMSSEEGLLVMPNRDIAQTLDGLRMPTESMTFDSEHVAIGGSIRASGLEISDKPSGEINLLWIPEPESSSETPQVLAVHTAKTEFGRFDSTFVMPAFGKGADGRLHPIRPGKGRFTFEGATTPNASVSTNLGPAATPLVSINGIPAVDPAMQALLIDGRAYVPLRAIGSLSKEQVVWHAATKSVLIRTKPETALVSSAVGVKLWIDNKLAAAEHQPILRNNITYVPIRAVTAAFGHEVAWWKESRSINIVIHAK